MKRILLGVISLAFCSLVSANQLLVSNAASSNKSGSMIGLDMVSNGDAVAIQFKVFVGENAKVDLSACVSDVPKGFSGQCSFVKGTVIGIVYNDNNALLPKGAVKIGSIRVSNGSDAKVTEFLASDASAKAVQADSRSVEIK
jgi:hypothetical protein